jgi:hypothetical protein
MANVSGCIQRSGAQRPVQVRGKPLFTFIFVAPFTDFSKELAISSADLPAGAARQAVVVAKTWSRFSLPGHEENWPTPAT